MVAQNIKQLQMSDDVNQTVGSPIPPHFPSLLFLTSQFRFTHLSFFIPSPDSSSFDLQLTTSPFSYNMSTNDKPTVIIVGAGLGGLMMGALFEKSGVPYTIFERAVAVKPLGMLNTCHINQKAK